MDLSNEHSKQRAFGLGLAPLVVAVVSLQFAIIWSAYALGFHTSVSARLIFHAIPVAISALYHGWPLDMTALHGIAMAFQSATGDLDGLISAQVVAQVVDNSVYYWNADDRGMGLFVAAAFALFGPRLASIAAFYFVLMVASVAAYCVAFRHDHMRMAYMPCLLAGWYVAFYAAPLAFDPMGFGEVAIPGTDSRAFDLLATPALLHLLLTARAGVGRYSPLDWMLLLLQAAVLTLLLLARSSLVLPLGLIFCVLVIQASVLRRSVTLPIMAVVMTIAAAQATQVLVYNPHYRTADRTFWHNALMGVESPAIRAATGLSGQSDLAAVAAVQAYARTKGNDLTWLNRPAQQVLNTFGGHGEFDWREYDRVARSFWLSLWRQWPGEMASDFLLRKPLEIWRVVERTRRSDRDMPPGVSLRAWDAGAGMDLIRWPFFFAVIAVIVGLRQQVACPPVRVWVTYALLIAASLAPAMLCYAILPSLLGAIALVTGGLVFLGAVVVVAIWRKISTAC